MIVITSKSDIVRCVTPGDEFHLTITDALGSEVIINENITVSKIIDFVASFRFALDDGTCPGFHLMGVFACKSELPKELQDAVMFEDLTEQQQKKFLDSVGVSIGRKVERILAPKQNKEYTIEELMVEEDRMLEEKHKDEPESWFSKWWRK